MTVQFTGARRVKHEESRRLEARCRAGKTMAERVIAGWGLAEDDLLKRDNDEPEKRTGLDSSAALHAAGVEYAVVGAWP